MARKQRADGSPTKHDGRVQSYAQFEAQARAEAKLEAEREAARRPVTLGVVAAAATDTVPPDTLVRIDDSNAHLYTPVVVTAEDGDAKDVAEHRLTLRRSAVFRLRAAGLSYDAIADRLSRDPLNAPFLPLDWGPRMARSDTTIYLDYLRGELTDSLLDVVSLEAERLDVMLAAIWPKIEVGNTRAIDTALKISERRSKLLGLDAALKVDWRIEIASLIDGGLITADQAAAELGPELHAQFVQWAEEQRNTRETGGAAKRALFANGFGSGPLASIPPGAFLADADASAAEENEEKADGDERDTESR